MKAFPTVTGAVGMDLRDYFAAKAMLGILCDPHYETSNAGGYDAIAKYAYSLADAMLKAREHEPLV